MAQAAFEHALPPDAVDALFAEHADRQYTRALLFSQLVELMGLVVCRVPPSLNAAIRKRAADLGVTRTTAEQLRDDVFLYETTGRQIEAGVQGRPGALELLSAVRAAGLRTALVTSTHRRLADRVLAQVGPEFFDVTVCGDEVPATKPDPSPYLQAMAALGVGPASCVVIEDSLAGITAGLAAGATVVGVPTLQSLEPQDGLVLRSTLAGLTVEDLRALLDDRIAA